MPYLVMELLEGTPLTGPMPFSDALRYALQVIDGLQAAHRKGIIHRDLKPANIILTKSGVKLLDFGLAKMPGRIAPDATLRTITADGAILGTLQYMAPEQLEGKDADARSDLFSFALVLFEMLTGKRAFDGPGQAHTIAANMLLQPPSITTLVPSPPPGLDRLITTCLQKDPEERFQSAHDVTWALETLTHLAPSLPPAAAPLVWFLRSPPVAEPIVLEMEPPANTQFSNEFGMHAISPDGKTLVFAAKQDENFLLFVRLLDSPHCTPIAGSDNPLQPFWSPDSRWVGFCSQGRLFKTEIGAGRPQLVSVIGEAPPFRGATWNNGGVILYSQLGRPLHRVSSIGRLPVQAYLGDAESIGGAVPGSCRTGGDTSSVPTVSGSLLSTGKKTRRSVMTPLHRSRCLPAVTCSLPSTTSLWLSRSISAREN